METINQIPKENTDYEVLREEWDRALAALTDDEAMELMAITGKADNAESLIKIQAYLTENFEKLSEGGRHFLLTSLRVKNLKV